MENQSSEKERKMNKGKKENCALLLLDHRSRSHIFFFDIYIYKLMYLKESLMPGLQIQQESQSRKRIKDNCFTQQSFDINIYTTYK